MESIHRPIPLHLPSGSSLGHPAPPFFGLPFPPRTMPPGDVHKNLVPTSLYKAEGTVFRGLSDLKPGNERSTSPKVESKSFLTLQTAVTSPRQDTTVEPPREREGSPFSRVPWIQAQNVVFPRLYGKCIICFRRSL